MIETVWLDNPPVNAVNGGIIDTLWNAFENLADETRAVVLREGKTATAEELRDFLAPNFAKWWLPDRFEFVGEIPKTSVGKFKKIDLREMFAKEPAAT